MRTAIFLLTLAVTDVSRALGYFYGTKGTDKILIVIFVIFVVMDVVEFLHGLQNE